MPVQRRESGPGGDALHASVLDTLGLRITSGDLAEGRVLTLDGIQEQFGVSRTVARETMRVLESMGLVTSRRRVGITVQPQSSWQVYDPRLIWWRLAGPHRDAQLRALTELRIAVEPVAAARAAWNASARERDRLLDLAGRMRRLGEAGELEEFLELDVAFHALLLESGGNEMFAALREVVAVVLRGRTSLGLMPEKPVRSALDLHEEVARAIASRHPEAAELAMRALVTEVRDAVVPIDGPHVAPR
ncbi:GntR family transcriptional regulator [Saccharothrix carnea]|uniref:GntR family transcriptional regulator n=1 Tax=Saccharothrix carnea TaxID=1280637 RepID=A0A2P8HZJ2_SACCR|nr:FCD domain-containing protein [Saccharothrix carnea]PSL51637.1 GntR family transcriptional regulator [Saccharothrix carnea]